MKIGNIEVGNIFLAPMAGVTDVGMRKLARKYGATLTYTEMVNAMALLSNNKATDDLLITSSEETPCAVQLFGKDAEILAKACASEKLKKFDIIDLNFGCPAPKIIKNGEGSALLKDLEKAREIIRACVKATDKPITVKMRKGFSSSSLACLELAKICQEEGVKAITIHGRTTHDMYSGTVDYDIIKKVKESVNIPVIGKGDITDRESYEKMLSTGVDAVMIGRGALGKPWIFNEILGQSIPNEVEAITEHIAELRKHFEERWLSMYMRKHLLWYARDKENASKYRQKLATISSLDEGLEIINNLFS